MKSSNLGNKIIEVLSRGNAGAKYNYKQIAAKVGVYDKQGRATVQEILQDFLEARILLKAGRGHYKINPKYLSKETTGHNYVIGRLEMKPGGSAFVVNEQKGSSDNEDEDIYIADGNLGNALHNDLVKVVLFPSRKGKRPEGQVVEIVERSQKQIVGVLHINKGIAYFIADNPCFRRDVLIPGRSLKGAHNGDKVVIRIVDWEAGTRSPLGEVIHVLGKPGDNEVEMQAILADNDFPLGFPETVEQEAAQIDSRISEQEIQRRRDFRRTLTFTIDPADAKDYDDAISYEKLDNGLHRVGIHIADVSFYVRPDTEIDHEAYLRGTSVYLVDRTIPMLP